MSPFCSLATSIRIRQPSAWRKADARSACAGTSIRGSPTRKSWRGHCGRGPSSRRSATASSLPRWRTPWRRRTSPWTRSSRFDLCARGYVTDETQADPMAGTNPKTAYYASVGPLLKNFDLDVEAGELRERSASTLPANIQYAWPHPSRRYLYVVSSNGGPGLPGDKHFAHAFAIDPATGDLRPHGEPAAPPSRPIHASLDRSGAYLLTAYNTPSGLTVHRLRSDGTIGAAVTQ